MRRKRLKQAIANLNRVTKIIPVTLNDEIRQSIQDMLLKRPADTVKGLFRCAFAGALDYTYDFSEIDHYIDLLDYIKQITGNKKER